MCEFISYIKKDGLLLYLTDAEIFSKDGKERLRGCLDNDVIGHGAIKKFYNFRGGDEYEMRNFWNANRLPEELAAKIADFDNHWGKTFQKYFMNDDLRHIIYHAPETWKVKAWKQLLKQKPDSKDLRYIIYYAPEQWKAKAWKQLLKQKPDSKDLRYIIEYAPEQWKAKAWKQLLKQKPTNNDLYYIIHYASEKWKAKALEQLNKN